MGSPGYLMSTGTITKPASQQQLEWDTWTMDKNELGIQAMHMPSSFTPAETAKEKRSYEVYTEQNNLHEVRQHVVSTTSIVKETPAWKRNLDLIEPQHTYPGAMLDHVPSSSRPQGSVQVQTEYEYERDRSVPLAMKFPMLHSLIFIPSNTLRQSQPHAGTGLPNAQTQLRSPSVPLAIDFTRLHSPTPFPFEDPQPLLLQPSEPPTATAPRNAVFPASTFGQTPEADSPWSERDGPPPLYALSPGVFAHTSLMSRVSP